MGLLDAISPRGEFLGLKRAFGGGRHSASAVPTTPTTTPSGGIAGGQSSKFQGVSGARVWQDEDKASPLTLGLRGAQVFHPFVNLWIYVAIAVFQRHWHVGPSGLTVLALLFNVEALAVGALFLAVPLLYDKVKFLRSIQRGLRQHRTAFLINAFQAGFMLIMAVATTVSAYTGGCKNPKSDPHADLAGYTDAMGGFCRNKRAGAAFFWFTLLAWGATLALVLIAWQRTRNNPAASGFAIPGAQFPADDSEAFAHSSGERDLDPEPGYRPSGDFYSGGGTRLFAETAPGYDDDAATAAAAGGSRNAQTENLAAREEEYLHPQATDPFADSGPSYSAGGHGDEDGDPYDNIRKSMDVRRPSY